MSSYESLVLCASVHVSRGSMSVQHHMRWRATLNLEQWVDFPRLPAVDAVKQGQDLRLYSILSPKSSILSPVLQCANQCTSLFILTCWRHILGYLGHDNMYYAQKKFQKVSNNFFSGGSTNIELAALLCVLPVV